MPRGGSRENAGRPAGSQTKRKKEYAQKAAETVGITPMDVMLATMLELFVMAKATVDEDPDQVEPVAAKGKEKTQRKPKAPTRLELFERAAAVARDAAPYVHPRLTAIAHSGAVGNLSYEQWLDHLDQ